MQTDKELMRTRPLCEMLNITKPTLKYCAANIANFPQPIRFGKGFSTPEYWPVRETTAAVKAVHERVADTRALKLMLAGQKVKRAQTKRRARAQVPSSRNVPHK